MRPDVVILSAGNERGGAASHIVLFASLVQEASLANISFAFVGDGPLFDRVSSTGATVHLLPAGVRNAIPLLRSLLKSKPEPCVLHAHGPRMNVMAYMAVRGTGIPWTSTIHSNPYQDFLSSRIKSILFPRLNLWCLSHAANLFIVSPLFAQWFPGKNVMYVPNGLQMPPLRASREEYRTELRRRLGVPLDSFVFGTAARFDPVKDIPTILRAVAHLQIPNSFFAIAGDGAERDKLHQLTRQLGIEERVQFVGFIDDVLSFYAGLDVHVLASKSEGTPFSLLEAGHLGVPNVTTSIPALSYLIEDGVTGATFPVGDDHRLAALLEQMHFAPEVARNYAKAFQRQVLPEFTAEKMLSAYLNGYSTMI